MKFLNRNAAFRIITDIDKKCTNKLKIFLKKITKAVYMANKSRNMKQQSL